MIKLKFNNEDFLRDIEFRRFEEHIVKVFGNIPGNTSGFILYNEDGIEFLGDWSNFKTIYKIDDDGIRFSDNGSIYTPPEEENPDYPKQYNFAIIWDYNVWDYVIIPSSVYITYTLNGESKEMVFSAENNWQNSLELINADVIEITGFEDIPNFEGRIFGNSIIYQWTGAFDQDYPKPEIEDIPEITEEE